MGQKSGLHVGLIGAGRIGGFHARTLAGLDGVASLAIADADPGRAERVAAELGARAVETPEALVSDDGDSLIDVYEREGGVTYAISIGDANSNATYLGSSVNGSAVFFSTYEAVLVNDKDLDLDIYGAYNTP